MTDLLFPEDTLAHRIEAYKNTAEINEGLHALFTAQTDAIAYLKHHRDWVEENRWGMGDRAFHYMWMLVLADAAARFPALDLLEIGVFKGQTISLWALISRELGLNGSITAISPFEGNLKPQPRLLHSLRKKLDPTYREANAVGNLHAIDDYLARNREIFAAFDLDFAAVKTIKGFSNAPEVAAQVSGETFALVYIDGDHTLEVACSDIATYAPLVRAGGYLIMDDAACFLPGETFWKGFESVSTACEDIPALGFTNVFNIGHNRIFQKNGG